MQLMNEQILDYYFDAIPACAYVKDLNLNYSYINHECEKLFHLKREELSSKNEYSDFDFFDADTAKQLQEKDMHVLCTGQQIECEDTKFLNALQQQQVNGKKTRWYDGFRYDMTLKFPLVDKEGKTIGVCGFSYDITEQKRKEKEMQSAEEERLREREQTIHSVLNASSANVILLTREGTILECNSSYAEQFHTTRDELIGTNVWMLPLRPPLLGQRRKEVAEVFETGRPFLGEDSWDGTWNECRILPASFLNGIVESVVIEAFDITESKNTQLALLESENQYRSILKHMQIGFALQEIVTDENGNPVDYIVLEVNPAFLEITQLTEQDIVGQRVTDVHPAIVEDSANWIQRYGKVALEGTVERYELFSESMGRWYTGIAYRPQERKFVVLFLDITERMQTEEALRESEERHRNLFESMMQGVVYQEASGSIIAANPSAERILGLTVDQMMGRTSVDPRWRSIHEDGSDFPGETHPAMVALSSGKPLTGVIMGVFHPQDESHHWITIDAIPRFKPGESEPYQVCTTFTDITETKRFEQQLLRAKEKAEEADTLKSAFLANMSHEIRTPLNGIMGHIDLALSSKLADADRKENLEGLSVAKQSGELLISIIQDILDLSKIEAGQLRVTHDVFSLRKVVDQTVHLGQALIGQIRKDIVLEHEVAENIADSICGDRLRLQQVLNNLVSNAVKFTDQGYVKLRIRLLDEQTLELCVRDTGKGIAEDHLETIFEPFRQVEIGHGGTGLGLTISRKLVELMGGELRVESSIADADHGATFYFTVPYEQSLKEQEAPGKESVLEVTRKAHPEPNGGGKILIAEDDLVSRKMANRMLEKAGYEVILAEDGQEAVTKFESNRSIDLILMDVQMPNMDGLEATSMIRGMEALSPDREPIPIVALSAGAMKGDSERGLAVGMTDYLTKPVNYKQLLETLEKHLGSRTTPLALD